MKLSIAGVIIFVICAVALPGYLVAQAPQTKQEKQTEKVKTKVSQLGIGDRAKVKIKLYNDTSYQGHVKEANEGDFVVVDKAGNPHSVKYSDVRSIGGSSLSTGAKLAIGIGIGAGAVLAVLGIIVATAP